MPYYVTIGTFDGVHRGHQKLIHRLLREARKAHLKTLALVFAHPPRSYFHPCLRFPLLTLPEERRQLLKFYGVDKVILLTFNRHTARMEAGRFFKKFLVQSLRTKGILVGADFAFGRDRRGTTGFLRRACRKHRIRLKIVRLLQAHSKKIGSSMIRELILKGEMESAEKLLGRPYLLRGRVVKGRGLGRKIGFPTANLEIHPDKALPLGVFLACARIQSRCYAAAVNIGTRPTINSELSAQHSALTVEAHLVGFAGDLTGKTLRLELLRKIREEKKFSSLAALRRQIAKDVAAIQQTQIPFPRFLLCP